MSAATVTRPHRQLSLDELIAAALAQARAHGVGGDDEDLSYLVELHERRDRETYERAVALTGSIETDQAILGLRIIRELGPWGARTFRADAVPFLRDVITQRGTNADLLRWAVDALGWQGEPTTLGDILEFVDHPNPAVRSVAVHNLTLYIDRHEVGSDLINALIAGTRDSERENRYSATYDLANWADVIRDEVREALADRLYDENEMTRAFAAAGLARSESGWRQLLAHHRLPELRIGSIEGDYVAIRAVPVAGRWINTAILIRGQEITWSAIAQTNHKDWSRWATSLRRYRAEHRSFTMKLTATLDVALTLGWHSPGLSQVTGRARTSGLHGHEGFAFVWDISEGDLDRFEAGLTDTVAELASV